MITCKEFPGKEFASQEDMFKALVENKSQIMSLKKSALKFADGFEFSYIKDVTEKHEAVKANDPIYDDNLTEIKVKVVINTTNLYDSHGDVHIKDIWKRSLSHKSNHLHLQEHKREFDKVISDNALAFTKTISWKSLGLSFEGNTEALIFESTVSSKRNKLMFEQYSKGYVKNHSVGMQYAELFMCINSEERWASEYKENWDKYYDFVANKEDLDQRGYFWAVTEAKIIEGSAVLIGSNYATPTLENNMKSAQEAPSETAPAIATQKQNYYSGLLN